MKKFLLIALALVLAFSFVACTPKEEPENENDKTENETPNEEVKTWGDATCEQVVNTIISKVDLQFSAMCSTITPDANPLTGLYGDPENNVPGIDFKDAAVYMPMISAQRFDLAVIRVKEGTDINAYVEDLKTRNANTQWICATPPDKIVVTSLGDLVLYLSIDSNLGDGDAIVEAFKNPSPIVENADDTIEEEVTGDETIEGDVNEDESVA